MLEALDGVHDLRQLVALRRYTLLARHDRDVILFVRRADGRILEANEAALDAYGYSRDELLVRTIHELREPTASDVTHLQMTRADEGSIRFEALHRRKDGRTFPVEVTSQGADVDGVRTLVSLIRDISERRSADEALRRSESELQTIVDNLLDGVVVADVDGNVLHWNRAALEMHGLASEDEGRRQLQALFLHFELSTVEGRPLPVEEWPLSRILRGEHLRDVEISVRSRRDGWQRAFCYGGRLVPDPAGRPRLAVVTVRDVTERRHADAARERLQVQVAEAQRLESIGRLAGGIAHDFNNLLTVILTCAGALRDELARGAPASAEAVEEIAAAGARAAALTRQLLAFARKQVVDPQPLDLNEVVRGCENLLRRVLPANVVLDVRPADGISSILCDRGQVEQTLLNLAINASDAMPAGGRLTIATEEAEVHPEEEAGARDRLAGRWIRLRVEDTGLGMTPEILAHAFEPFFTTKEVGKGTGLGLAMVHGIVSQAGGHIHVKSQAGQGTTFEICLPRIETPPPVPPTTATDSASGGSEVLLVVEDDDQVRAVTVRILGEAGYHVLAARGADEALDLAGQIEGIRLIVSDVVMPGVDGCALVDDLRRRYGPVQALYVSGYPQDVISSARLPDHAVQFLSKPFTREALLARVRALLDAS